MKNEKYAGPALILLAAAACLPAEPGACEGYPVTYTDACDVYCEGYDALYKRRGEHGTELRCEWLASDYEGFTSYVEVTWWLDDGGTCWERVRVTVGDPICEDS